MNDRLRLPDDPRHFVSGHCSVEADPGVGLHRPEVFRIGFRGIDIQGFRNPRPPAFPQCVRNGRKLEIPPEAEIAEVRRELTETYPSFEVFKRTFEIPNSVIDNVIEEGEKLGIKPHDKTEKKKTLDYMKLQLKALVARDLWGMDEYFSIMNESSPIVQAAIGLLSSDTF